jgi:FkbM family methyltransferase
VWERETIAFMCAKSDGADIVHAGTFFGDFLPALSKATVGTIWAFEAVLESYRCAKTTIALNELNNVELRHAALGASNGVVSFATTNEHGHALGGASHVDQTSGTEPVVQIPLDDAITLSRPISILQLDVEGYENEVLKGAQELIRRHRPIIILETVPEGFADRYGYAFDGRLAENSVFRPLVT